MDEGYHNLIKAMLWRAVLDYQNNLKKYFHGNYTRYTLQKIDELEAFFKGRWFSELTEFDGQLIIDTLQKNAREDIEVRLPRDEE